MIAIRLRAMPATVRAWPGTALLLGGCAVVCWFVGLAPVDPARLDGFGILPALSPILLAAYPLLVAAVVVELCRGVPRGWVLTVLTALGAGAVYGLQPAIEPVARMPVAWLHAGFADYIGDHGAVLSAYDARMSWPGFFGLVAFVTRAAGYPDTIALVPWAPLPLGALATLGVRALAVVVLGDGRAGWLAPWVFLATNWTEQEYFSPQGTSYLLLLAALVLTVKHLVGVGLLERWQTGRGFLPVPANATRDRTRALIAVVLIAIALAPTHQLTPYVLAGFLFVLWFSRRLWAGWLPALALLAPLTWFVLGAQDYWSGQLAGVVADAGDLSTSVDRALLERVSGDLAHQVIVVLRVAITGIAAVLAAVGLFVLRRSGRSPWTLAALVALPFGLVIMQPYGGEMLIRSFLFALPFVAIAAGIAGAALLDTRRALSRWVVWGALSLLCVMTVTAKGGNDAYVASTRGEVAALEFAYRIAQDGDRLDVLVNQSPLRMRRVGEVDQAAVMYDCPSPNQLRQCLQRRAPDIVMIGPAQENFGRIIYGFPPGWTRDLLDWLEDSGGYRVAYDSGGSQVVVRTSP